MKSNERWRYVALLLTGTLAGCAASPQAEMQPGSPGVPGRAPAPASTLAAQPEPQTLAEAEALLDQARADLERLALNDSEVASGAAAPTTAPAPAPPAAEPQRASPRADVSEPTAKAENPCENACRAFSSLNRARDAVCRLDAEGGKRCARAREIQEDASRRVASCGCVK